MEGRFAGGGSGLGAGEMVFGGVRAGWGRRKRGLGGLGAGQERWLGRSGDGGGGGGGGLLEYMYLNK